MSTKVAKLEQRIAEIRLARTKLNDELRELKRELCEITKEVTAKKRIERETVDIPAREARIIGLGTAGVGAVSTSVAAAIWTDWGPVGVFLATLGAGAAIGIAYIAWALFWHRSDALGARTVGDLDLAHKHESRLQDKQDLERI